MTIVDSGRRRDDKVRNSLSLLVSVGGGGSHLCCNGLSSFNMQLPNNRRYLEAAPPPITAERKLELL